jgi:hypothetical protein
MLKGFAIPLSPLGLRTDATATHLAGDVLADELWSEPELSLELSGGIFRGSPQARAMSQQWMNSFAHFGQVPRHKCMDRRGRTRPSQPNSHYVCKYQRCRVFVSEDEASLAEASPVV